MARLLGGPPPTPRAGTHPELAKAEQPSSRPGGIERRSQRLPLTDAPVDQAWVLEVGEGPPLLLVHGAGMSGALWAPPLVHLRGYRRIAVRLPGCGLTDVFVHRGAVLRDHARSFLAGVLDVLDLGAVPGVALSGGRGSHAMSLYSRPRLGRLISAVSSADSRVVRRQGAPPQALTQDELARVAARTTFVWGSR